VKKVTERLEFLMPLEGQPYHALFYRYISKMYRILGWMQGMKGPRITKPSVIRGELKKMASKLKEIKPNADEPELLGSIIDSIKESIKAAKQIDDNWHLTIDTRPKQEKQIANACPPRHNKAEMAVGGELYYFQPLPDGLLFNMEDVRQNIEDHGLSVVGVKFKPPVGDRIHEIKVKVDPPDKRTVQLIENEIDAYLKSSPIMQGGKRSIIVQTTDNAELLFIIEEGISRVFEGEPDDINGY
jgi:hypothetical protein